MDPLRRIVRTASHTGAMLRRAFSRSSPTQDASIIRSNDFRFVFENVNDSETACGEEDTLSQVAPGGSVTQTELFKGCVEEVKEESDYTQQHAVEKRMPGLEIHLRLLGLEKSIDAMYNSLQFSFYDVKQWDGNKLHSYFMCLDLLEPVAASCADELLKADVNGYMLLGMNEESLQLIKIPERQAVLIGILIQAWKGQLGPMIEYVDGLPSEPHPWASEDLYRACMDADHKAKITGEGAVYGQLMVLGYKEYRVHGSTWHPVGRRNERFVMRRALAPTGIQRFRVVSEIEGGRKDKPKHHRKSSSTDVSDGGLQTIGGVPSHVISMTIGPGPSPNPNADPSHPQSSQTQKVSFQFTSDRSKDMFQLGRMLVSQNDFVVRGPLHMDTFGALCGPVSRYACRIECDRLPPFKTRIYAAGFNDKQQIFLSENAPKWQHGDRLEDWDALTTFGVRVLRPDTKEWREISVNGNVYMPRENMNVAGRRMPLETNELDDGCIIDLAGIQLLYQSPSTLASQSVCMSEREVVKMLNAKRPQCPVMMHTIAFSSESDHNKIPLDRKPYVFPACGHVHGYAPELIGKPCPLCRCVGPFVPLNVEWEPALCADNPTVVFNPCGHMVTEQVAEYWASVSLPDNAPPNARYRPICPFCARPLKNSETERPYNRLIVQERGAPRSNSSSSLSSLVSWEDKSCTPTPTLHPNHDSPGTSPMLPAISPVAALAESPQAQTHTHIHSNTHALMMRSVFNRSVNVQYQGPVYVPVSAPSEAFPAPNPNPNPNPSRNPRPTRNSRPQRNTPTLDIPQLMQLNLALTDTHAFISQAGPPMAPHSNRDHAPIAEDEDVDQR